jgi:hypothetical protein
MITKAPAQQLTMYKQVFAHHVPKKIQNIYSYSYSCCARGDHCKVAPISIIVLTAKGIIADHQVQFLGILHSMN